MVSFLRMEFSIYMIAHHPRDSDFKFHLKSVKLFGCMKGLCILQQPIPYCVFVTVYTLLYKLPSHIFFSCKIPQMFWYGKYYELSSNKKSQGVWKNLNTKEPGSFKLVFLILFYTSLCPPGCQLSMYKFLLSNLEMWWEELWYVMME